MTRGRASQARGTAEAKVQQDGCPWRGEGTLSEGDVSAGASDPAVPSGAPYSSWPGCGDDSPHVDSASGSGDGGRGVGRDRLRAPKLPGLRAPAPVGVTAAGPCSPPPAPSLLQRKAGTNMASPGGGGHASLRHAGDTGLLMESPGEHGEHRAGGLCASDRRQGDTNASLSRMLWKPADGLSGS